MSCDCGKPLPMVAALKQRRGPETTHHRSLRSRLRNNVAAPKQRRGAGYMAGRAGGTRECRRRGLVIMTRCEAKARKRAVVAGFMRRRARSAGGAAGAFFALRPGGGRDCFRSGRTAPAAGKDKYEPQA